MFEAGKNSFAGDRDDDQFDEVGKDKGATTKANAFLDIGMRDQHKADSSSYKEKNTTEQISKENGQHAGFSICK